MKWQIMNTKQAMLVPGFIKNWQQTIPYIKDSPKTQIIIKPVK